MTRQHPDLSRMIATAQKAGLPIFAVEQAWIEVGGEVRPVLRIVTQATEKSKPVEGKVEW